MQLKHPIEELFGGRMSIQVDIVVDHVTSDGEVDHGHVRLLGSFLNAGPTIMPTPKQLLISPLASVINYAGWQKSALQ